MTPPFSDMGEAAVCARVTLAWLKLLRKREELESVNPHILIGIGVERLSGLHFDTVRLALLSLSVAVTEGRQSQDWLKDVCYRDLMGFTIRRCYYDAYKATRHSPRVTNRGARG